MSNSIWHDIDLSRLEVEPSLNRILIELSSNYNGDGLASIVCTGLLIARISTAFSPNGSQFPIFVGKVQVSRLPREVALESLQSSGFGFKFDGGEVLPTGITEVFSVEIEGGEIEAFIIAMKCDYLKSHADSNSNK